MFGLLLRFSFFLLSLLSHILSLHFSLFLLFQFFPPSACDHFQKMLRMKLKRMMMMNLFLCFFFFLLLSFSPLLCFLFFSPLLCFLLFFLHPHLLVKGMDVTLILFLKGLILLLSYFFFLVPPDVVKGCKREKIAGKKCVSERDKKIVREKKKEGNEKNCHSKHPKT